MSQLIRFYIGIDPGVSGGLAVIRPQGIEAIAMPTDINQLWCWFRQFIQPNSFSYATIEQVTGYVAGRDKKTGGDYENSAPGHRMFTFGTNYGACLMGLAAAGISSPTKVIPRSWQKQLGIDKRDHKGGEQPTDFKRRLKEVAVQLFPSTKVTLKTCDALLLALYCKITSDNQ